MPLIRHSVNKTEVQSFCAMLSNGFVHCHFPRKEVTGLRAMLYLVWFSLRCTLPEPVYVPSSFPEHADLVCGESGRCEHSGRTEWSAEPVLLTKLRFLDPLFPIKRRCEHAVLFLRRRCHSVIRPQHMTTAIWPQK